MAEADSMVERVARAIFDKAVGLDKWENEFYEDERCGCYITARHVIAAMREPTGRMETAGDLAGHLDVDSIPIWHAMIDAALRTEQEQNGGL